MVTLFIQIFKHILVDDTNSTESVGPKMSEFGIKWDCSGMGRGLSEVANQLSQYWFLISIQLFKVTQLWLSVMVSHYDWVQCYHNMIGCGCIII